MATTISQPRSTNGARLRLLTFPREHGAWGILLIPLTTGAAIGMNSADALFPLILFSLAALALFCLRTPVESWLAASPLRPQTATERRAVFYSIVAYAAAAAVTLSVLIGAQHAYGLLVLGTLVASVFSVQAVLKKFGRQTRMSAQLIGSIGLTSTAAPVIRGTSRMPQAPCSRGKVSRRRRETFGERGSDIAVAIWDSCSFLLSGDSSGLVNRLIHFNQKIVQVSARPAGRVFDGAIVAGDPHFEFVKNRFGFRIFVANLTNDVPPADEVIEVEHGSPRVWNSWGQPSGADKRRKALRSENRPWPQRRERDSRDKCS